MELNKWHNTRTGAFDFAHTAQMLTEISGNSDQSQDPDIKLKATMKPILLCDLNKENLTDPEILPQVECVITVCLLDYTSKDEGDYKRNLKKIVKLLKPGGHLILFGVLNTTYCIVGEEKFHAFKYDEKFVKEALIGEGLSIDYCEVNDRKGKSELSDYEAIIFIAAHKGK
ncbi:indolethylamine N-methyltransferase-like [Hyla sarda]|uniref:indolethylamine N-methyltransferase-like n=1 Tax=Hyla sarda TaxID=327740 RepID=UPI0024C2105B|nr:indolethylamine N-methyltransferase-like [Hyla sarda]